MLAKKLGFMRDLFSIWYSTGNIRKSVFIIGIKGLLVAVRGRSISKLSNIMIFSWAGLPFPACLLEEGILINKPTEIKITPIMPINPHLKINPRVIYLSLFRMSRRIININFIAFAAFIKIAANTRIEN